jgi:hypothetical protein
MDNNINKEMFLDSIADSSISTIKSESILHSIPDSDFESMNDQDYPIEINSNRWLESYFQEQLSVLKRQKFSKERALHIITVKKYLQDLGIQGFYIDEENSEDTLTKNNVIVEDNLREKANNLIENTDSILKQYNPKYDLEQSIIQKDYQRIQALLDSNLNNYRMLLTDIIKDMLYVYKTLPKIFQDYKVDKITLSIDEDKEEWSTGYFYLQQSYLNHNFAIERLMHLINVRDFLTQQGVEGFEQIKVQSKPYVNQRSNNRSKTQRLIRTVQENDFIRTAVMVGGAVLAGILALIAMTR